VSEKNVDVKFVKVFDEMQKAGKSEDDIKMGLLKAGLKFSEVNIVFNKMMIDGGFRLNRSDKLELVTSSCEGQDLMDATIFNTVADNIAKNANLGMASAIGSIRAWAKAEGFECFKKPRSGGGQGTSGFMNKFQKMLKENPAVTSSVVDDYIKNQPDRAEGLEPSSNVQKHASMYRGIAKLVNDVYASAKG